MLAKNSYKQLIIESNGKLRGQYCTCSKSYAGSYEIFRNCKLVRFRRVCTFEFAITSVSMELQKDGVSATFRHRRSTESTSRDTILLGTLGESQSGRKWRPTFAQCEGGNGLHRAGRQEPTDKFV